MDRETVYSAFDDRFHRIEWRSGTASVVAETQFDATVPVTSVAASPRASDRIFLGTFGDGVYRSTDGGESFERLESGDGSNSLGDTDQVMALAVSPHDPSVVYAGTEPSRVYRSADAGETWTELEGIPDLPSSSEWSFPPRPKTHHVRTIAIDPFDPKRLYVGIEAGALVVTTDGGKTWTDRPRGSRRDNHTLSTHADREGRVYSAAGDGYAESDDCGETWQHPQDGLEHRYCWDVVADPGDPDHIMVSSASGARRAHRSDSARSFLYRKAGSDSWQQIDSEAFPTGDGVVRACLATTGEAGVVYAISNACLARSDDFGDTWHRLDAGWSADIDKQLPHGIVVV